MNGIKQGNRSTINLLQKNVSHTRPTAIQNASNQQITTLLPKKNHHKRGSYNLAAVLGLIKILIDQLASPSQKEKGETLNCSQKQSDSPQTTLNIDHTQYTEEKNATAYQALEKTSNVQQAFEVNKEKWQQSGIKDYFYTFQRSCFCTRDTTREVLTHVRNGSAITSQFKDSGQLLPESLSLNKLSINDLFTTIETALDKNADVIQIKYDNKTGQPTSIYIDGKTGITDDEFSLIAKELKT